jgi:flagellar motility protein MotE (MotC chaperone)
MPVFTGNRGKGRAILGRLLGQDGRLIVMSTDSSLAPAAAPDIENGSCYAIFAYDAARSVDLDAADRSIREATRRPSIRHKRRTPSYFEYQPAPLRVSRDAAAIPIGRFATRPALELMVYDFGAVAVIYTLTLGGPFEDLLDRSEELYDNPALLADSRRQVEQLLNVIGAAAQQPNLSPVVEDYVIFHIESFAQEVDAAQFCTTQRRRIAQILRAERQPLSDQEIDDALTARISYGVQDITVVDWNAALVIDRDGDDVRAVLEFANVELLEVRYLDQKLDRALDEAYDQLSRRAGGLKRMLGYSGADLRRVAELQVDNALLFEGVNNTLKLLGDQYLARVYRLVNRRLHIEDWDGSILRKLQTLESIYEKISDQAAARRIEILEWIIIILIALSIALEFI